MKLIMKTEKSDENIFVVYDGYLKMLQDGQSGDQSL